MAQDGIIIVTLTINERKLVTRPSITTRGFVLVNDNIALLHDMENKCKLIVENKLKNVIVEFAYFDKPVGVNNENIIIYELRTEY